MYANTEKYNAIRNYLMNEGNYDFPFNCYLSALNAKTGNLVHPHVWYYDCFYNYPEIGGRKITLQEFANLVKNSPKFNPNAKYIWFEGDCLYSADDIYPSIYDVDAVTKFVIESGYCLEDDTIREILKEGIDK